MTFMGAAKEQLLSFGDPAAYLPYFAGRSRGGNYVPVKDCALSPFTSKSYFLVALLISLCKSLKGPGYHLIYSPLLRISPRKLNIFTKLSSWLVSVLGYNTIP